MRLWLTTLILALGLAGPAAAQTATSSVDEVARALESDPVYVDPDAEAALSESEVARLRRRLARGDAGPLFVAILPESAREPFGGSATVLARAVREAVARPGTYVVVSGRNLQTASDVVADAPALARQAIARGDRDLARILDAFVGLVARERLVGGSSTSTGRGPSPEDGTGGGAGQPGGVPQPDGGARAPDGGAETGSGGLVLLGLVTLGGGAFLLARRSRRRREDAAELEYVKDQVRDELVELGDGIRALDLDVEMPGAAAEARTHYERALAAYDRANDAWNTARTVEDLEPVGAALEEGRWALAAARASLEGRPVPERRPPCFFDPRHGPSAREVEWAPPGGTPRPVPACEADAQAVDRGVDPGFREIDAGGGHAVPYWAAGPAYSPFYGRGMFGGFGTGLAGGLLGGLMLGEMLDGPDWAHAGTGFGDGDFGGGDFGGGDFGGGDFGGGDFGGGDF